MELKSISVSIFRPCKNFFCILDGNATYGEHRAIWIELKTHDGTALHLNIRMGQNMENIIVVNSYHHGKWGHEDRHFSHVNPDGPLRIHMEAHHKHFTVSCCLDHFSN